jgi:uncharacterized protein (TIGR03437 family)
MGMKQYRSAKASVLPALVAVFPLLLQAQSTVISAGYTPPRPVDASPGQVITIFVRVAGKAMADPVTAAPPLPTSLGGFTVVLRQSFLDPAAIPILSVVDSQSCSQVMPMQCDTVSQITVEIPFELMPNIPHVTLLQNFARLEIAYQDTQGNSSQVGSLFLNPVPDSIHLLNSCDAAAGGSPADQCLPMVVHADGSFVTGDHPAAAGETVTMSVAGMGQPLGMTTTGAVATAAIPLDGVSISFDARENAAPSQPLPSNWFPASAAQLRPLQVGIYDISFQAPALPSGVAACSNTVRSNLTVNVSRISSFAGVGICVQ